MENQDRRGAILELETEIESFRQQIVLRRSKILKLMEECPHDDKSYSREWDGDARGIVERRVTCNTCKHSWNEQKDRFDSEPKWPSDEGEYPDPHLGFMHI